MTDLLANVERAPAVAPTSPDVREARAPEADPLCAACGRFHGSVGAERQCMRRTLAELRARLEAWRPAT